MDPLVFLEWSHRLLVLTSTVIVLVLVVVAWRRRGTVRLFGLLCLGLVVATAVIGGIAVLTPTPPWVAALDQALALLYFAGLVGLTTWSYAAEGSKVLALDRDAGRSPAPGPDGLLQNSMGDSARPKDAVPGDD